MQDRYDLWHARQRLDLREVTTMYRICFLLLQPSLLEDAVQGARWQIHARLARDGDGPALHRMLELPVAALLPDHPPILLCEQINHFLHFHDGRRMSHRLASQQSPDPAAPGSQP